MIQPGREPAENLAVAFNNRGNAYGRKGQPDRAIQDYDQAIRLNPNDAASLYGRGLARRANGDIAGGNRDIAAAQAIDAEIAGKFERWGVRRP